MGVQSRTAEDVYRCQANSNDPCIQPTIPQTMPRDKSQIIQEVLWSARLMLTEQTLHEFLPRPFSIMEEKSQSKANGFDQHGGGNRNFGIRAHNQSTGINAFNNRRAPIMHTIHNQQQAFHLLPNQNQKPSAQFRKPETIHRSYLGYPAIFIYVHQRSSLADGLRRRKWGKNRTEEGKKTMQGVQSQNSG